MGFTLAFVLALPLMGPAHAEATGTPPTQTKSSKSTAKTEAAPKPAQPQTVPLRVMHFTRSTLLNGQDAETRLTEVLNSDPTDLLENPGTEWETEAEESSVPAGQYTQVAYTPSHQTPTELGREMLKMLNSERAVHGLKALVWDNQIQEVGLEHSGDMLRRHYFSHTSPDGKMPWDRCAAHSLRYLAMGENLAQAPTLALAHQLLMDSPGHRANVLSPDFNRVGIGIASSPRDGLLITEVFFKSP